MNTLKKTMAFGTIAFMLLINVSKSYTQDTTDNLIISFVPQYMIISGMRVDIEKRIGNTDQWLLFGPQVYLREKNPSDDNYYYNYYDDYDYYYYDTEVYDMMAGYGITCYHKIFMGLLEEETNYSGTYLAYGLSFQNFFFKYKEQEWVTYEENGMEYLRESETLTDKNRIIYKMGLNLIFGYQILPLDKIICDVYMGAGMRYSLRYPSYLEKLKFNNHIIDYGYSGITPVVGFRLGIVL